jgi:hypothetical protein
MSFTIIGKDGISVTTPDGTELNSMAAYMAIQARRSKQHTQHEANGVINNIAIALNIDFSAKNKLRLIEYLTMTDEQYLKR